MENSAIAYFLLSLFAALPAQAVLSPSRVLIVYQVNGPDNNQNGISDSLELAQYYAQKRGVPTTNLVGITVTAQWAMYSYYQDSEYQKFLTEFVGPIQAKLAQLGGPATIDVILLAGAMPTVLLNAAGGGYSIDNWLMGMNYWSTTTNSVNQQPNPYFAAKPSFQLDLPHFDHNLYKFNGTDMYLVSRLGSLDALKAMDRLDGDLYAERYLSTQSGYYKGTVYVDSYYTQPDGTKYTDASLAASPYLQSADFTSGGNADVNIAYGEHFAAASGLPWKWENTGTDISIGQAGAMWSDGSPGADVAAPRALFYGGWYNFDRYYDVWDWLPGSVACDLNSATYFAHQALDRGASAVSYVISEPLINGHQRPNILLYYILKGYPYAEASTLATPDVGWVELNEGDPLYAPMAARTPILDTQSPALSAGFPTVSLGPDPFNHPNDRVIHIMVDDTPNPEVVKVTVNYGLDTNYGSTANSGEGYWRRPTVLLPSLQANTIYHYQMVLVDPAGNATTSGDNILNTTVVASQPPVITGTLTAQGTIGTSFAYQIFAANGAASFTAAPLPSGLSFNTNTGLISGIPLSSGTFNIVLTATNSGGTSPPVTLVVTVISAATQVPVINSPLSAQGTVTVPFTYTISGTNNPSSYAAAPLPGGLSVDLNTGVISGVPASSGTYSVSLTATNTIGPSAPATLTLTINPAPTQIPVINSPTSAQGTVGSPFSYKITATNNPNQYIANGLPAGVSVNIGTGLIVGTPISLGTFNVTLYAYNAAGASAPAPLTLTIALSSGAVVLPPIDLSGLPSYAGLNDSLSITNYPDTNVSFFWSFAPAGGSPYSTPAVISRASTAGFKTGAKTSNLSSYGLQTGTYLVSVFAIDNTNSNNVSPTVSKTITLVSADFSALKIYPNPWRSDKHAGKHVTFDQLPLGGTVKIFTVSGRLVKRITPNIATATWDLTNDSGDKVASGVYVYLITVGSTGYGGNGQNVRGKIAVIR